MKNSFRYISSEYQWLPQGKTGSFKWQEDFLILWSFGNVCNLLFLPMNNVPIILKDSYSTSMWPSGRSPKALLGSSGCCWLLPYLLPALQLPAPSPQRSVFQPHRPASISLWQLPRVLSGHLPTQSVENQSTSALTLPSPIIITSFLLKTPKALQHILPPPFNKHPPNGIISSLASQWPPSH